MSVKRGLATLEVGVVDVLSVDDRTVVVDRGGFAVVVGPAGELLATAAELLRTDARLELLAAEAVEELLEAEARLLATADAELLETDARLLAIAAELATGSCADVPDTARSMVETSVRHDDVSCMSTRAYSSGGAGSVVNLGGRGLRVRRVCEAELERGKRRRRNRML